MSDKTGIEWTDATWNPVTGCSKVSQGCKHCYAERQWPRMVKLVPAYSGRDFTDVRCHPERLDQPLRWKRPRKVFVNSMSDLFHEDVPFEFIDKVFAVMALSPQHTFQVLTKRAERMRDYFESFHDLTAHARGFNVCAWADSQFGINDKQIAAIGQTPNGLPNVWLGVSVEDQAAADERIPLLLDTPAAVRWISAEPLLGPVQMEFWIDPLPAVVDGRPRVDWVVVGGESGPSARPMHPQWARSLRDQCASAGVPFLFKQWGEWHPAMGDTSQVRLAVSKLDGSAFRIEAGEHPKMSAMLDRSQMHRIGKKAAGRLLDGVLHDGYPMKGGA